MSNILITDITIFTDIAIEQQENIVGGAGPLPSYIPLNPAINGFLEAFDFNLFDLQKSLNIAGLDIKLPIG